MKYSEFENRGGKVLSKSDKKKLKDLRNRRKSKFNR